MLRVLIVCCFYILTIGYVSMELDWKDRRGRTRNLFLKGWQESDLQEFIWVALVSIAVIGGVVWFSR